MNVWKHLKTINHHKMLVLKGCFRVGLYRQGLLHDLSKYSPAEFLPGCKYYTGKESPHNMERKEKGYSSAWLHHKGRNKHHLEYWTDYGIDGEKQVVGMKMPIKYVAEMFIDRVSASKNYLKERYTDASPLEYYEQGKKAYLLHDDTRALLEKLLHMLATEGEDRTFRYVKEVLLRQEDY